MTLKLPKKNTGLKFYENMINLMKQDNFDELLEAVVQWYDKKYWENYNGAPFKG